MELKKFFDAAPEVDSWRIERLIEELLGHPPALLFVLPEPTPEDTQRVFEAIYRLRMGVPAAYITGKAYLYGMALEVNPGVLIPRYDTESVLSAFARYLKPEDKILDIGCGSGALGIALKDELPKLEVHATDISPLALKYARKNAQRHELDIHFHLADLFPATPIKFDAIISNPPYISESQYQSLSPSVRDFEPAIALLGGKDGLDYYRRILEKVRNYLTEGGIIAFEHGYDQQEALLSLTEKAGFRTLEIGRDMNLLPRFIIIQNTRI